METIRGTVGCPPGGQAGIQHTRLLLLRLRYHDVQEESSSFTYQGANCLIKILFDDIIKNFI